jgi:hypothetical protein
MKLKELIDKLQEIDKSHPGVAVSFKKLNVKPDGPREVELYPLDVGVEYGICVIALGIRQSDAVEYKSQVEQLKPRNKPGR